MGNCACICTVKSRMERRRTATAMVVDTSGNVNNIKLPLNCGELMIDQIGHVITPAEVLQKTRRILPLGADDELLPGKLYLLVPASRVNSKASASEMAKTHIKKHNKTANMAKVSPSKLTWDHQPEHGKDQISPLPVGYQGKRRWCPVLDPIFESSTEFKQ
ncbi:hypothetical protein PIB30_072755 [Stylosanthes scabra]|uniref:Uncharacterized protein n=1 Tax=Stylosanthes scabra TaxID=79078 RepID=A0ABU6SPW4_9FABA|nr:hypothetical protein [Stylosanthes scabra]